MTTQELTHFLKHPEAVKAYHEDALEKLSANYPFFQAPQVILLKSMKASDSFKYNQQLKKTAALTADRSILFDFITSSLVVSDADILLKEKKNLTDIDVIAPEEIKVLSRISMDDAIDMQVREAEEVLNPALFSAKKVSEKRQANLAETLIENAENQKEKNKSESALRPTKPFEFHKNDTFSFMEWLQLTNVQPIDRNKDSTAENDKKSSQTTLTAETPQNQEQKETFALIDKFINKNPKIAPVQTKTSLKNLAKERIIAPDELMTETLAKVYLAQNKYNKAIQAYKILILKNPEKSGFFADQIKAIQKLQDSK